MSIDRLHLRKFVKLLGLPPNKRVAEFRSMARDDARSQRGELSGSGGDFYNCFWSDAKNHVFGRGDLRDRTQSRIDANSHRAGLYPLLCDGFLQWWDERRRWHNEPFAPSLTVKTSLTIGSARSVIRLDNILSVRDSHDVDHFIYPYWFANPELNEHLASISVRVLLSAFPDLDPAEVRVLDIIRGQTFSVDRVDLTRVTLDYVNEAFNALRAEYQMIRDQY